MKIYLMSLLLAGVAVVVAPGQLMAQVEEIIKTEIGGCGSVIPTLATKEVKTFSLDRINKTLHGVWRGRVSGKYDERLMAGDGYLNVDYYMLIDIKRKEAMCFEQFSDNRSIKTFSEGVPAWSALGCGNQYLPPSPAQVHEFHKVSDDLEDARAIMESSTGLKIANDEFVISAAWKELVEQKYFEKTKSVALAGAFFQPFEVNNIVNKDGVRVLDMRYETEIRGLGETAAKFEPGVPMRGFESAQFVGVSTASGDFLVSSLGNGAEFRKSSVEGGLVNMYLDKLVIGPLLDSEFAISEVFFDQDQNGISMMWPSTEDASFVVERSTDLQEWTEVGVVAGTRGESNFTDTELPDDASQMFYRVRVQR